MVKAMGMKRYVAELFKRSGIIKLDLNKPRKQMRYNDDWLHCSLMELQEFVPSAVEFIGLKITESMRGTTGLAYYLYKRVMPKIKHLF